ncbi:hypothetical protein SAMN05216226_108145 [Halovenus aranensis]|jgi:hypothetical protein|uniref:Uncharacterized protein n=1 Tax=Halovenus aranensis TaxID=890420 RepID=A0A1G8W914_9EURY|nr:hypothetical protein [Halovenus aranensis]SDJ74771.1 hypothetical protein SAMN05216226_108145 [Halovenus aranensis]
MGVVEQSQETVEEYLSALEESYRSFPVNQTTVAVAVEKYQRERERAVAGSVDSYAKVTNEADDVLHLEEDGDLRLPSARTSDGEIGRATVDAVEHSTGVTPRIDGIEQATILGIHDTGSAHETVFRLAVIFEATRQAGSPNADAVWHSTAEIPEIVVS